MKIKTPKLETFENEYPDRNYTITHTFPEFTSVCPKTGQPDFAELVLTYIPNELCIELKSLKLYYNSYRDKGIYYESATNKILDDLVKACKPRVLTLTAEFKVRGGISSKITVEYIDPEVAEELDNLRDDEGM